MRSSRIARQTARVFDALSSPRRSLRGVLPETPNRRDSSPLSSPPQTPVTDRKVQISTVASSTRKRKRDAEDQSPAHSTPQKTTDVTTTTATRTSPRKKADGETPRKARRQPAKKIKGEDGNVKIEPPPNWEQVYNITKEMRAQWLAPVDTMGCESLAEDKRTPRERRFQTLVALMLSSQTKDTVTAVAMKNLQEGLPGGFTVESMRKVEPPVLNGLINKVGFHNNKTKFIKQVVEILAEKHDSDIPDTIEGLVALPGVGPKMAYLCMSAAWGRDEGIGVDVHVHRITNLWGWHKTSQPEETRMMLESWLPKDKWHDINHLLVGFGQTYCPPVGRKCDDCKLSQGLCPSAVVAKTVKEKVRKETVKEEDGDDEIIKEEIKAEAIEEPLAAENAATVKLESPPAAPTDIEDALPDTRRRSGRITKVV